ncbi:MAG: hypothetical protein V4638_03300 [Bacteroidota bacterium]
MLHKIFLLLVISLSLNTTFAATTPLPTDTSNIVDRTKALFIIDEGRTLFQAGQVRAALLKFREAAVQDPYTFKAPLWIAECHYRMNNYGYALQYARQAINLGKEETDKEVYHLLGRSYHRMLVLDSAIINYNIALEKLTKQRAQDLFIQLHIEQAKFAHEQIASGKTSKKVLLDGDVNSSNNDYNPILINGGKEMYFSSRRSDTKGGKMNPDDQEYFEDVYRAIWDAEFNKWDSISNDLGKLNSEGFDAITYMAKDGKTGLMTVNMAAIDKKGNQSKSSDIYEIELSTKGTWNTPKRINNKKLNTSYFEGSATMTDDGNTMYFASDRKGDKSSMDIYMVEKVGKKWGTPKVLPMGQVNSSNYETTPFISGDGKFLFYSSDGFKGMGGLDIYVCENLGGGQWGTPVNLGIMVNTVNNDSHFKFYPELSKAVMASFEVIGQKASLDMYQIDMTGFEIPKK